MVHENSRLLRREIFPEFCLLGGRHGGRVKGIGRWGRHKTGRRQKCNQPYRDGLHVVTSRSSPVLSRSASDVTRNSLVGKESGADRGLRHQRLAEFALLPARNGKADAE